MTKRQYIGAGIFGSSFFLMALAVPALAEQSDLTPAIVLGVVCLGTMVSCLLFGDLSNITLEAECKNMEDDIMNTNIANVNVTEDNPFLSFGLEELGTLYKEVAKLASASLAVVSEDDDREKPREKALFKLAGVLKGQIEIRRDAEARLIDAVQSADTEE